VTRFGCLGSSKKQRPGSVALRAFELLDLDRQMTTVVPSNFVIVNPANGSL
jgi:hypothetical protein